MADNEIKNIIIGTAGHVDHGKTELIKALSGIDTDRLEEEKRRGITIELGFAHIPNEEGYNIGVIDVPGHEKFIKNMLAGIGGIDFVLFTVAADEGIMPQTKEHFEIINALGIDDGIIAITKKDLADDARLEALTEEIKGYFKGTFLEGKPIIPVSAVTGENVDVLKKAIIDKCSRESSRRMEAELFRLPIDRVFTMQGFGTVVTGTLTDGNIKAGDDVIIYPGMKRVKARGIQTYGKDTDAAYAGQRTAVNLAGISKDEISRGDVLARSTAAVASSMLDVKLKVFESSEKSVQSNSRVHLYTLASEVICKVILMDRDVLLPGEECYAQLRLERSIAVKRGDKFIIRFYSPLITIGGGQIIDALPQKHKRNREDVLSEMGIMADNDIRDIVYLKAGKNRFIKEAELAVELGITASELADIVDAVESKGRIVRLSDYTLVSDVKISRMRESLEEIIKEYHADNPLAEGIPRGQLMSRLAEIWHIGDEKLPQAFTRYMFENGVIEDKGKSIALAGFAKKYSQEQQALKDRIAGMYKDAGFEMIKTDEILQLGSGSGLIKDILADLEAEGEIIKINPTYHISSEAWNEALASVRELGKGFKLADFRDRIGTSRRYAEEILNAMDKKGITVFNGQSREAVEK